MVQIFADVSAMRDGLLAIGGSDYNHIRNVLRMHPGEELTVRTGDEGGEEYLFEIVSFTDAQVNCRLLSVKESESELPVRVLLFQGLPKSDKMDFIIQKSIQATRNIPIDTRHPEKLRYLRTFPWRCRNKNQYLLMERESDFTH